jgi:hypothetical protein
MKYIAKQLHISPRMVAPRRFILARRAAI